METKHLSYFKVENFKRFDSLEVNDIGQFNLIVGDNNVGKTSLLEALLFDDENYDQTLYNLRHALRSSRGLNVFKHNNINFLDFYSRNKIKSISFTVGFPKAKPQKVTLSKRNFGDLNSDEQKTITIPLMLIRNTPDDTNHLIEFSVEQKKALYFTTKNGINNIVDFYPFVGVNINHEYNIGDYLSEFIESTKKRNEIIDALKYFIPNIISVEINTAILPGEVTTVVREENDDLIKPIAQYGDGTNKFLRYILEMNWCENKRLMIDEIDAGIHYSRMKEFLEKVLQTAKNKKVQLFATTHSKECIEYFKEALKARGLENEGRIIRIANTKSGIKSYTMRFEEFENALEGDNEIR